MTLKLCFSWTPSISESYSVHFPSEIFKPFLKLFITLTILLLFHLTASQDLKNIFLKWSNCFCFYTVIHSLLFWLLKFHSVSSLSSYAESSADRIFILKNLTQLPLQKSRWLLHGHNLQYRSSAQGFGPKMHSFVLPCSTLSLFVQQQLISVPSSVLPASEAVLLCHWHLISKSHLILLEHQILHISALWAFFTKIFLYKINYSLFVCLFFIYRINYRRFLYKINYRT